MKHNRKYILVQNLLPGMLTGNRNIFLRKKLLTKKDDTYLQYYELTFLLFDGTIARYRCEGMTTWYIVCDENGQEI